MTPLKAFWHSSSTRTTRPCAAVPEKRARPQRSIHPSKSWMVTANSQDAFAAVSELAERIVQRFCAHWMPSDSSSPHATFQETCARSTSREWRVAFVRIPPAHCIRRHTIGDIRRLHWKATVGKSLSDSVNVCGVMKEKLGRLTCRHWSRMRSPVSARVRSTPGNRGAALSLASGRCG